MSDLLDSVRAANPVPWCEQPSVERVWSKLERDQPGAGEQTGAGASTHARRAARGTWRGRVDRRHLGSGSWPRGPVAALLIAAASAAAVVLLGVGRPSGIAGGAWPQPGQPSAAVQRLVRGTISCDFGATGATVSVSARGRSAIVFCRNRYRTLSHAGAGTTFVACETSATNVAVYIADGRHRQCARLGDRALPAGYAAAVRRAQPHSAALSPADPGTAVSI